MSQTVIIANNRFGLGARPGDLDRREDPRDWLLEQLGTHAKPEPAVRALPRTPEVLAEVQTLRREQQASSGADAPDIVRRYSRAVRSHYLEQTTARYAAAAATDRPFRERLVHFWANHFAVSADKQPVPAIAGLFENEAIRPHVTGSFADLLIAAERHPAMLLYLDNAQSIGPNSTLGTRARRRGRRNPGLNENLAREILELHTLGVSGGYSQGDVVSLAEAITGWSIGGAGQRGRFAEGTPGTFEFREMIHEPGAKTVLGKRYPDAGLDQGLAILRDLATHPSTARHVCTKLVRHFVADAPPPELVDRLTATWLGNDGELGAVYADLLRAPEAWTDTDRKYKSPHDFVVSTLRALDRIPDDSRFVVNALDLMGQTPWRPGSPAGWPDTAAEWGGADSLYKRIEWSDSVARLAGKRTDPVALGDAVLGSSFSNHSRTWISRAESRVQGLTLLLASPDFQRR